MTGPQTKAQVAQRRKRAGEGEDQRRKGWVELDIPDGLLADAQHLRARWDPGIRRWIGKPGVQDKLEAIAEMAPNGALHFVVTEDCPWCERKQCFRRHSYRTLGSEEWALDYYRRCDFCFALTSHPLFDPAWQRDDDQGYDDWADWCWDRIYERQVVIEAKGEADRLTGIDISQVWPTHTGRLLVVDNDIQMAQLIEKLRGLKP